MIRRLGDIVKIFNGRAFKNTELFRVGKYPVLRVGNFFSKNEMYFSDLELDESKYCFNGDLLFAWSASFGPKIWYKEKTIYHYHIWKIIPSDEINKEYLYYWLLLKTESLKKSSHGSVMAHLTKTNMENFQIDIPSKEIQEKIAKILGDIDKKIETNKRINKNLEFYFSR